MIDKSREALRAYAEEIRADFERDLKTLVEIPSISSDPSRQKDMLACADAAKAILEKAGAKAEI